MRLQLKTAALLSLAFSTVGWSANITAKRFAENPLITVHTSPSLGDNVNGPTIIRVPAWVKNPLGRYYMYFAHHKGQFIRLVYADSLHGPWKIYEPGVMKVSDTAFFRPQPDPERAPPGVYTHVASPEIYIDSDRHRIVMWFHGSGPKVSAGRTTSRKPGSGCGNSAMRNTRKSRCRPTAFISNPAPPSAGRVTCACLLMTAISTPSAAWARCFAPRTCDLLSNFVAGADPFRGQSYDHHVRHVALLPRDGKMDIFFSIIGSAPESILHTTMTFNGDWTQWKVSGQDTVLTPEASYECRDLPVAQSEVGEIYGPARQLRDPEVFVDDGKTYLFYTVCGEQGIAAAELTFH